MGLFSKAIDKIAEKIEEVQTCPGCGCNFERFCGNCTRSDCHCAEENR